MATKGALIAEGKTKRIYESDEAFQVLIESKNDITARDGEARSVIEGMAELATTTTCNCFELLNRAGIKTHYIGREDYRTFLSLFVEMIPIEGVVRRVATGSYLKRYPQVVEGTIFQDLVVEFFWKDDARHDPLVILDFVGSRILYYDAKKPLSQGFMEEKPMNAAERGLYSALPTLVDIIVSTFITLERAWAIQNVTLVDFKGECGWLRHVEPNELCLADVIDNSSWRVWLAGDKDQMKDKQVFRNLEVPTPEALAQIKDNFAWVAEATGKFLES